MQLFWQLILSGFALGSVYALLSSGFALLYRTTRFIDFTFAISCTVAAYAALASSRNMGVPLWAACGLGVLAAIGLSLALRAVLFRWLLARSASPIELMLASLGAYVVLENCLALCFGVEAQALRTWSIQEGFTLFGARVSELELWSMVAATVSIVAMEFSVHRTHLGRAILAVAEDLELSQCAGLSTERVISCALVLGTGLGGLAGVLLALDTDIVPGLGFRALLMGFAASVVGGVRATHTAALGGLTLGVAQSVGVWRISSQWQDAIAFGLMTVCLLFRPQGLFVISVRERD